MNELNRKGFERWVGRKPNFFAHSVYVLAHSHPYSLTTTRRRKKKLNSEILDAEWKCCNISTSPLGWNDARAKIIHIRFCWKLSYRSLRTQTYFRLSLGTKWLAEIRLRSQAKLSLRLWCFVKNTAKFNFEVTRLCLAGLREIGILLASDNELSSSSLLYRGIPTKRKCPLSPAIRFIIRNHDGNGNVAKLRYILLSY